VGNKQYITTGNLRENDKAFLFLMDYETRTRVKIWGRAEVISDATKIAELMPENYEARPEQAIVFHLAAWDSNCQQHIPLLVHAKDVAERISELEARVRELESELEKRPAVK
jgi:predicted pyridoxine 5'-phosphate oxidase superfamily flavin-nucleotide-binding protein